MLLISVRKLNCIFFVNNYKFSRTVYYALLTKMRKYSIIYELLRSCQVIRMKWKVAAYAIYGKCVNAG